MPASHVAKLPARASPPTTTPGSAMAPSAPIPWPWRVSRTSAALPRLDCGSGKHPPGKGRACDEKAHASLPLLEDDILQTRFTLDGDEAPTQARGRMAQLSIERLRHLIEECRTPGRSQRPRGREDAKYLPKLTGTVTKSIEPCQTARIIKLNAFFFVQEVKMKPRAVFIFFPVLLCLLFLVSFQRYQLPDAQAAPIVLLPDLDVTFIQREPLYSAYCVDYHWDDAPGMPGRPTLCPGTENQRRWPEPRRGGHLHRPYCQQGRGSQRCVWLRLAGGWQRGADRHTAFACRRRGDHLHVSTGPGRTACRASG